MSYPSLPIAPLGGSNVLKSSRHAKPRLPPRAHLHQPVRGVGEQGEDAAPRQGHGAAADDPALAPEGAHLRGAGPCFCGNVGGLPLSASRIAPPPCAWGYF